MPDEDHTTRFPAHILAAVKARAKATNRSIGGQIREYVADGLRRENALPEAPAPEPGR